MHRRLAAQVLIALGAVALAGCAASATGSPTPSQLDLTAVTGALQASAIVVVDVADDLSPSDGAWLAGSTADATGWLALGRR
jgi:hypothetical protein